MHIIRDQILLGTIWDRSPLSLRETLASRIAFDATTCQTVRSACLDSSAVEIIASLSLDPTIEQCFALSAGVSEGLSVGEHSRAVIEIALKYRSTIEPKLSSLVAWEDFLLFLALHDIGKGTAKAEAPAGEETIVSTKVRELAHTRPLLRQSMECLQIAPKSICIFEEMLAYDSLGQLLRGIISEEEAYDNLVEMSFKSQSAPLVFLELFDAFHICDAASYDVLRHNIFQECDGQIQRDKHSLEIIQKLVRRLQMAAEGEASFDQLLEWSTGDKASQGTVAKKLVHDMPKLLEFIKLKHKQMLSLSTQEISGLKESFRHIKRGFRDIFLYGAEGQVNVEKLMKEYLVLSGRRLGAGNGMSVHCNDSYTALFFGPYLEGDEFRKAQHDGQFIDELLNFRKNYICRFSMAKVGEKLGPTFVGDARALLPLTFIHGTNSAVLPSIEETGLQLVPFGRLRKMGIVPFSGELGEGATACGVNQTMISGTSLDQGARSVGYAQAGPKIDPSAMVARLMRLDSWIEGKLKHQAVVFETEYNCTGAAWIGNLAVDVRRLRALAPGRFEEVRQNLEGTVRRLKTDFALYQQSDNFKGCMPRAEDPSGELGYRWHDYYWMRHFKNMEGSIQALDSALTDLVHVPQKILNVLQKPYPLVFGSSTLHTKLMDAECPSERCAIKSAQLGKDIQWAFVQDGDGARRMKLWLESNALTGRVKVDSIANLQKGIMLNRLLAPYFSDIASASKLQGMIDQN